MKIILNRRNKLTTNSITEEGDLIAFIVGLSGHAGNTCADQITNNHFARWNCKKREEEKKKYLESVSDKDISYKITVKDEN